MRPHWLRCVAAVAAMVASLVTVGAAGMNQQGRTTATPGLPSSANKPAGLLLGRAVDASTNRPIARATVTLAAGCAAPGIVIAGGQGPARVLTNADGQFLFRDLPKGTYPLGAIAPGYLCGGHGQQRPEGATHPFVLDDGQRAGDLVIRLWREAAIGGLVTDDTGAPVVGVTVWIDRQVAVNGRVELRAQQYGKRTDDRGMYSQAGLAPGDYLVSVPTKLTATQLGLLQPDAVASVSLRSSGAPQASPGSQAVLAGINVGDVVLGTSTYTTSGGVNALATRLPVTTRPDGRVVTYPTTFHPSAASPTEATVVRLGAGDERNDINVELRPVVTVPVSGTLLAPDGPAASFAVHLIPAYAANTLLERSRESAVTTTDQQGRFTFPAVASGSHVLKAWRLPQILVIGQETLPPDTTLWAEVPLSVGEVPTDIMLNLRPGATLAGRIVFEGTTAAPPPQRLQTPLSAAFEPLWPLAFGARLATRVTTPGEFITQGLPPGRYVPKLPNNFSIPGWYFASATREGKDLFTSPLVLNGGPISGIVITLTDRRTEMAGLVTDAAGNPDPSATVLVFPADYELWIQNGLSSLAARSGAASHMGTYAMDDLRPGDYLAVAVTGDLADRWQEAAAVRSLAQRATRVTLATGLVKRQDLRSGR
jgi:hypothetical protein